MHSNPRLRRKAIALAVLTTATCWSSGLGCIQTVFAIIGASFF